jgi:hypothetical protein
MRLIQMNEGVICLNEIPMQKWELVDPALRGSQELAPQGEGNQ